MTAKRNDTSVGCMSFLSNFLLCYLASHDPVNPAGISQNNGQKDDHRKEHQVQGSMTAGRTVLLITHRLVDLHRMDKILMLERGRIIEQGSHEALLKGNTRYAALQASIL
jgi:ABC-type cobalamin transport system ATPase subunit